MAIQIFPSTGGTASFNGVLIPATDLVAGGIQSDTEFADAVAANLKRDKALLAIAEVSTAFIANLAAGLSLGLSVTRPNTSTLSWTYSLTYQAYELLSSSTGLAPLPVPVSGANSGIGDFAITDIFPNAEKVASGATVSESGVLIESASLARYDAPAHASLSVSGDNRDWLAALFRWIGNDATAFPTRSTTEASAVTAKSVTAPTTFTLPTAATATTNPTTAIANADRDVFVGVQFTTSITLAMALSGLSTQTYEVDSRVS